MSIFVSKVSFTLHPSFAVPVRGINSICAAFFVIPSFRWCLHALYIYRQSSLKEVLAPPFEVTEIGWGEFEVTIRIFFRDPEEYPVDLHHNLRLYPAGPIQPLNSKKPVMAENYGE